jgi:hypothetical protein
LAIFAFFKEIWQGCQWTYAARLILTHRTGVLQDDERPGWFIQGRGGRLLEATIRSEASMGNGNDNSRLGKISLWTSIIGVVSLGLPILFFLALSGSAGQRG